MRTRLRKGLRIGIKKKGTAGFETERKEEMKGPIDNGTFLPTKLENVKRGTRIFCSRFIEELKKAELRFRIKSQLVAQNYSEEASVETSTKAPIIQRLSGRILLSLVASMT